MSPRDDASTSTPSRLLKRKVRDDDEDEDGQRSMIDLSRSDAAEEDGSSFEDERRRIKSAPKKKKQKKQAKNKIPKLPKWKDLKRTKKKGLHPGLGCFPVEVLDQIISFDSDLNLRDHLALAGTCRFFRTIYRDVVFQVLFKHYFPSSPDHAVIVSPLGQISWSQSSFSFVGPSERSPGEARKIFSHAFKVSLDGWGISDEDWEDHVLRRVQEDEGRSLINFLDKERASYMLGVRKEYNQRWKEETSAWEVKATRFAGAAAAKSDFVVGCGRRPAPASESALEGKERSKLLEQIDFYGDWIDNTNLLPERKAEPRDPWKSEWRYRCAEVVNRTMMHKANAVTTFKMKKTDLSNYLTARLRVTFTDQGARTPCTISPPPSNLSLSDFTEDLRLIVPTSRRSTPRFRSSKPLEQRTTPSELRPSTRSLSISPNFDLSTATLSAPRSRSCVVVGRARGRRDRGRERLDWSSEKQREVVG